MFTKWLPSGLKKGREFASDNHGATAVEFGIILMGIFEVGALLLIQTTLETVVLQVSRYGRTGSTVSGQTPAQVAAGLVDQYGFGLVNPANVVLTVTPYANFSAMPTNAQVVSNGGNTGTQNYGTSNAPVLYTLTYNWTFFTPLLGKIFSPSTGSVTLISSSIVQNEPFGS
jgi:Flp pilus assembly protein TadG